MNIFKYLHPIYFLYGLVFSSVAFYLSLKYKTCLLIFGDNNGDGADIPADGGALSFALLSGICFFCCAYLSKKR